MPVIQDLSVALGLLLAILGALELGFRAGRRDSAAADPRAGGQIGSVQGAIIGLLGLLLGFTFAAAGGRFLERQDLIVQEANAIGTASLRADLLDPPHRLQLLTALKEYTEHRIEVASRIRDGVTTDDSAQIDRFHARMWEAARAGVEARPSAMLGVLPPINDVIDLHSTRIAAGKKRLPSLVMGLLIACSLLSMGVIGYGCGTSGRRRAPLTVPLGMLIGASLWISIDLDQPRAGLIQLSDAPLKALKFDLSQK